MSTRARTHLVRRRFDLSGFQQDPELVDAKVADANAPTRRVTWRELVSQKLIP